MPSYSSSDIVKKIRQRKRWQQTKVIYDSLCSDATLSRIENRRQKPGKDMLKSLMNVLQVPIELLLCPFLENQTMETILLCRRLSDCIDSCEDNPDACETAESMVETLESMSGFEFGRNRQFLISCKVRLLEIKGEDASGSIEMVKEGVAITFLEFEEDNFEGDMLLSEEIELLHTLAAIYNRIGQASKAIKLLYHIKIGLDALPEDDHEKEKKLVKILLSLSKLLIESGQYSEALEICEVGNRASVRRENGKNAPDFLYNKAVCLFSLGQAEECESLLYQAYFGYTMLRKEIKAENVLKRAKSMFGIEIETYGVEMLAYDAPGPVSGAGRGEVIYYEEIGELIGALRAKAGMTLKELSVGICSVPTLHKIEKGGVEVQYYYLEAFMQRLGRDVKLYANTFLSAEEFESKQLRNEISARLIHNRGEGAAGLVAELESKKPYKKGVNLQFIKMAKATLLNIDRGDCEEYLEILLDGVRITFPDYDESLVEHRRLTYYEIILINQIAVHYSNKGDMLRGTRLLERLCSSMSKTYVDEAEKVRMYTALLYNYSKNLGKIGSYSEALEVIKEAENLSVKHGRLSNLYSLAVNKACDFLELGEKERCVPHFAQAYYGAKMFNETHHVDVVASYVKKRLNLEFR
ncbi:MAG: transcriptional regulator [Oscillospiraceae bacterium]|nr:transcriptional regulator [Oscillospiraceae bacterium]